MFSTCSVFSEGRVEHMCYITPPCVTLIVQNTRRRRPAHFAEFLQNYLTT